MNYKLYFPTYFNNVNPINDNIDVCIELPNGKQHTFVVSTPQNLQQLIQIGGKPYLEPCAPFLFVDKLTEENIRLLLDELVENPILLRIYGDDL
ncbi:MAG: hypothetical protein IJX55_06650 [Clostridia bacterium]|nr:hypothetical protein [Clostridia bacterium]